MASSMSTHKKHVPVYRGTPEAALRDITSQTKLDKVTSVDIVIPAFNEERCIADTLNDVLWSRKSESFNIQNIYVISDASTYKTESIVRQMATNDQRIKPIRKPQRNGKQKSINLTLSTSEADIVIFIDADVRLGSEDSIEKLISHFSDDNWL